MRYLIFLLLISNLLFGDRGLKIIRLSNGDELKTNLFGNYKALIIGNQNYKYINSLKTPINDVVGVANILEQKYGFKVEILKNSDRNEIVSKLNYYANNLKRNDNFLLYYAGHGYFDKEADTSYWLPIDAKNSEDTNWIMASRITSNLRKSQAKHILIISDSCYSGTLSRNRDVTKPKISKLVKNLLSKKSRTILSSGGNEPVSDGVGRNSVFAKPLIEELKNNNESILIADELFINIREVVAGNSRQTPEYSSIKNSGHSGGEFIFVNYNKLTNGNSATKVALPKEKSNFSFHDVAPTTFSLNINPTPYNAIVKITNIKPKYYDGIKLKKGRYNIKVSKNGYISKEGYIDLKSDLSIDINLEKEIVTPTLVGNSSKTNSNGWDKSIFSGNRSYSKNSTNTVKDNLTSLIWQKSGSSSKYSWNEAKNYCSNLSLDGYNNWRLPTYNELYYLADRTKCNPAIDTNYFNSKIYDWYWTNTEYKNDNSKAWIVGFDSGNDDWYFNAGNSYVRCVK